LLAGVHGFSPVRPMRMSPLGWLAEDMTGAG
jgi:hypothetical protein